MSDFIFRENSNLFSWNGMVLSVESFVHNCTYIKMKCRWIPFHPFQFRLFTKRLNYSFPGCIYSKNNANQKWMSGTGLSENWNSPQHTARAQTRKIDPCWSGKRWRGLSRHIPTPAHPGCPSRALGLPLSCEPGMPPWRRTLPRKLGKRRHRFHAQLGYGMGMVRDGDGYGNTS